MAEGVGYTLAQMLRKRDEDRALREHFVKILAAIHPDTPDDTTVILTFLDGGRTEEQKITVAALRALSPNPNQEKPE